MALFAASAAVGELAACAARLVSYEGVGGRAPGVGIGPVGLRVAQFGQGSGEGVHVPAGEGGEPFRDDDTAHAPGGFAFGDTQPDGGVDVRPWRAASQPM